MSNIITTADTVEMSFGVPDNEKDIGKNALKCFKRVVKLVEELDRHINYIYNPFSSNERVSVDSVFDNRGALIRYKTKVRDNFNKVTRASIVCIANMNYFTNDTQTAEIMKSFVNAIGDIEDQIDAFDKVFNNFKSEKFKDGVVGACQGIKKQSAQLTKMIYDRILNHINTNILASSWQENLSQELKMRIDEKEPYIKRLYREREKQIEDKLRGHKD